MINNMDGLYRVIQKGDVILVEGNSEISRMIKLFTQSSWSHSALYVGDEILVEGGDHREPVINQFGKDDAKAGFVVKINFLRRSCNFSPPPADLSRLHAGGNKNFIPLN